MATGPGPGPGPKGEEAYDSAPFGYLTTSVDGVVEQANRTLLRWLGREREDVLGKPLLELLMPGSRLFFETQYRAVLQLSGHLDGVALDLRRADGTAFPVLVAAEQDLDAEGPVVARVSLFPAGTRAAYERELRRSRTEAQLSEARLRLVHDAREACRAASAPAEVAAGVAHVLGSSTRGGQVSVWFVDGTGDLERVHGPSAAWSPATATRGDDLPVAAALRDGSTCVLGAEELRHRWPGLARDLREAGREALLLLPLTGEGSVLGVVQVALRRERPAPPDELAALAAVGAEAGRALLRLPGTAPPVPPHDTSFAGAEPPSAFGERVGEALARAAETERPLAVLLLDLAPGGSGAEPAGPVGEPAVVELGRRLQDEVDGAVRVGAHRFAVLAEGTGPERARVLAERLQSSLAALPADGGAVAVTVGAVVVEPHADGRSVAVGDVIGWASGALHEAVARGPGRRVLRTAADRKAARALVHAERTLRRALDDEDVVVHYQPVVNLRTGRVVSVEALCRVRLLDGSLLLPTHFIDAAEDSGLLLPLGQQVLATACRQRTAWAARGVHVDVAVNVTASQAADARFAQEVREVLASTGCAPQHLVLELTESALLAATSGTLRSFTVLRGDGVRVALDDFGTRYASLDYVRSFPLDELKVDQSFVAGLPGSRVARAIVRMVAQLADELDLACVAEGIETAAQAHFLRDLGVLGQGFAVGRPVPAEQVVPWLTPAAWLTAPSAPWDLEQEAASRRG